MNLKFWKKRSEDTPYAPYEEVNAKKTSLLGYFFLAMMIVVGVWQGNNFLSALSDSISVPQSNSPCLYTLGQFTRENTYYNIYSSGYGADTCNFTSREREFDIDNIYGRVEEKIKQINDVGNKINIIEGQIRNAQYNRGQLIGEYEVSLLESIAKESGGVLDKTNLKANISSTDEYINVLQQALSREQNISSDLTAGVKREISVYAKKIKSAEDAYAYELIVREFKQFALSLLLILPIFIFIWWRYGRAKRARSEYTIIWGGAVATVGVLVAQVLVVFVYEILPREIIQRIFAILAQIKFLWAIMYWLGFILVPIFFGFLIYLIQKKLYNKRAVMMRSLKSGKCPGCSLKTSYTMNNCPVCGYRLKEKCNLCGTMSMSGAAFCEGCGAKKLT